MAVSIQRLPRIVETLDLFGFLADVLAGLNVRHYNYVGEVYEVAVAPSSYSYDDESEWVCVPFAVLIHDDGMDYNEDGTSYMDDYPSDWLHSAFNNRKAAETEICWLEKHGVETNRITIAERYWVQGYELKSHPVRD